MPANKSELGREDRRGAPPGQAYELGYFARKHRISKDQAEEIIRQARGNREQANTLARWRRNLRLRQRAVLTARFATNGPAPRTVVI
jgi:hypothetical protein